MRLFVALNIDAAVRERIARFMSEVRGLAPDARWVRSESLHVTLKFIGEQPPAQVERIKLALSGVRASPCRLAFRGTGFFPTPRAARVYWVGIQADDLLPKLASQIDKALAAVDVAPEDRAFSPHLTLARGGDRRHPRGGSGRPQPLPTDSPKRTFARLQEKLAQRFPPQSVSDSSHSASPCAVPEFGEMLATEFLLFESKLLQGGAQYAKLASFELESL